MQMRHKGLNLRGSAPVVDPNSVGVVCVCASRPKSKFNFLLRQTINLCDDDGAEPDDMERSTYML